MHLLAVNILMCFARADQTFIQDKHMLARIPSLSHVLLKCQGEHAEETRKDILELFKRASSTPLGARWVLESNIETTLTLQVIQEALQATRTIDRQSGRDIARGADALAHLLPSLARLLAERQDQLKLDMLSLLDQLATTILPTPMWRLLTTHQQAYQTFLTHLRSGLWQLLREKSASRTRDQCLSLLAHLLEHLGEAWLFQPTDNERQLVLLAIRLACIEIRVGLDAMPTTDDRLTHLLPVCFILLEHTIHFLTTAPDEALFDMEQLLQLRRTLQDTFSTIIAFLCDQRSTQDPMVLAGLRVLMAWLAEDEALHSDACDLLPTLISLLASTHPHHTTVLHWLTPALLHMLDTQMIRDAFASHHGPTTLAESILDHTQHNNKPSASLCIQLLTAWGQWTGEQLAITDPTLSVVMPVMDPLLPARWDTKQRLQFYQSLSQ
jgi:hypothetical protein